MSDYAIDTASRFGEIPFVEFTKELVTGVFDSLVEAHLLQMEEYANFVNSITQDLTVYINNTKDGVTFDQISDFLLKFELPKADPGLIESALSSLQAPTTSQPTVANPPSSSQPASIDTWWGGLINALAPAVTGLVDKIKDPNKIEGIKALNDYNNAILLNSAAIIPTYKDISNSVAALIASNKYALLQNIVKQGMMRLVVTEGEVETKITFSTWNNSISGSEETSKVKTKNKIASNQLNIGGIIGIFNGKKSFSRNVNKVVTVNTAKSYQRDSSGTRVDIFGRVLIKFKTDYQPLNGF